MKLSTSLHIPLFCLFLPVIFAVPLSAQEDVSNNQLKFCISSYKDGFYQKTVDCINEVFPGLSQQRDSVLAYKYLGLSYGLLNNISRSKEYFVKAFAMHSSLALDTLEFPPTIALILNQIRLEMKLARMEKDAQSPSPQPAVSRPAPVVASEKKSPVLPIVLQSTAVIAAGGGGYFFNNAYKSYRSYKDNGSDRGARSYSNFKTSVVAGVSCTLVSLSLTTFSLYLIFHDSPANRTAFKVVDGNPALTFQF
jgi:hypothetical protein